jgi:hypothetical protein
VTRGGRDLELLVALLEQVLRGDSFEIRSPDIALGHVTGVKREVDVTVRHAGSDQILVMLECQDRKRGDSLTWVEQLATKRRDVGAKQAVAISTSGFSPAARRLAQTEGLDLHELQRLSVEDVFSWLGLRELDVEASWIGPGVPRIECAEGSDEALEWLSNTPLSSPDEAFFLDTGTHSRVSLWQLMAAEAALAPPNVVRIPPDGVERHATTLTMQFPPTDMRYQVPTPHGSIPIATLEVDIYMRAERLRVPLSGLSRYAKVREARAETAEFRFELDGEQVPCLL